MPYYPEYSVRFFKKRFLGIHLFGEYGNPEWENSKLDFQLTRIPILSLEFTYPI